MASLVIDTGVATHPQISVDQLDLKNGRINFRWIGGVYAGDCSEVFPISLAEHGEMTVNEVVAAVTAYMISTLLEATNE